MSTPGAVLDVVQVAKAYGHVQALRSADLHVTAGEVHALLGQNGAGKSTLIKILNGLEHRDSGTIMVGDQELVHRGHMSAAKALGLSFIHQDLGLIDQMSVADNMGLSRGFPRRAGLVADSRLIAESRAQLEALDSDIDPTREVGDLDGAEKAVVALARSLVEGARLIVLDEPTARLHEHESGRLFDVIRRLKSQGVSFIYVTHRLDEVFQLADRVTVLRDGRTVATDDVSAVSEDELVRHIVGRSVSRERQVPAVSPSDDIVLRVSGLTTRTLRGLDLEVRAGEVVGLTGLVASGANDLGRALFGDVVVESGTAAVNEADQPWRASDALAAGVAYVPGDRHERGLAMDLPVSENIVGLEYVSNWWRPKSRGWLRLLNARREKQSALVAMGRFEIARSRVDDEVSVLSGGNQQKVLLAKWLREAPPLAILEEPTQGVDVGTRSEIYNLIRSLAEKGSAVVLASSDSEEVAQICTRVVVLRNGVVAAQLIDDEITADRVTEEGLRSA